MTNYHIDFNAIPWESPEKGIRTKTIIKGSKKLRIVEFSNDFVETDWCLKGHIGYILEGEIEIDFDGSIQLFKTGEGLFIPKGQKHRHQSTIQKARLFLVEEV
ncbi:MAG: hypothetical protein IEMM0008_0542 [bacterium]|nr:MAG: hypothetical protein IEMM0008_0542 [bacterium]